MKVCLKKPTEKKRIGEQNMSEGELSETNEDGYIEQSFE